ncbi:adhesion G-protein coupled receptor V1-like isoform X2 [Babylonia areolata]|uniref:adhesion G-protein coupled receptor V1-like isoform X2 n=1 Tax=Babylonia areolata TaxID=304850 RepID=UPI003FD23F64
MFQVELANPTGGAAVGEAGSVMVVINASDNAYGVYQFADNSLQVLGQETGDRSYKSVFLKVLRLGGTIGLDTVLWTAIEDLDDGQDLVESSGSVQFAAGQNNANLEIKVRGDTLPELDEILIVKLTQVTKGTLGDSLKCSSTVTIEANDDPYGYFVIVNMQRPVRVDEEPKDVSITVRRLYGTYGAVTVTYQTLAPDETYNYLPGPLRRADYQDFEATSGNITFQEGQEFGTFTVTILDDTDPEQDESVFVRLTATYLVRAAQFRPVVASPRLGLESESYAQIIISSSDDASGILQLSPTALTVKEGVGVPPIRVTRTGGTFGEVTVQFRALDGKAQDMHDYTLLSRQVILTAGQSSKLLPLMINDDPIPELSESFAVELLDQITGGATLGVNRSAVITIEPSDDPNGVFGFAAPGMSVEEPENGQPYKVPITVERTGGSMNVVTLYWNSTLNGEPPTNDISPTSGSMYFVSNEGSLSITVSILPDDVPEGTEDIIFTLLSATAGGRVGAQNTFTLSILPNDSPHGYIQFASPTFTVQEGPTGPQDLQLTRSGGTYGRLRVYYSTRAVDVVSEATRDGSTVLSYFLSPVAAQRDKLGTSVDVSGESDELMVCSSACLATEACRSFQFGYTVSGVSCEWFSDTADSSDLIPAVNLSVYAKDVEKVQTVLSRIAKPGEDYVSATENSILIQDSNTTGQLPITILDDSIPELQEIFTVVLLRVEVDDPSAETRDEPAVGQVSTAMVTIATNDNAHGAFRITSDSPTADLVRRTVSYQEQDRLAVDLIVERDGGSIGEVTVTWHVSPDGRTATPGTDFLASGATLTFTPGQKRSIVTMTILDDTVPEDDEQFTVQLTNPGGGATLSSDSHMTVIILANDNVAGVLAFNTTSVLAKEGDRFMVGVERTQSTMGTVGVKWVIEGLNGLQPHLGFRNFTGSLTFLPGESEKTITFDVLSDDTPEIKEEYLLKLKDITTDGVGVTGAAVISPQKGTASITIEGSNDPHGVVQFSSTSLFVDVAEDAGFVRLQVDRKFGAIGTVRVTYQVVEGAISELNANLRRASQGQDFRSVTSGSVSIPGGFTSATISVAIVNDMNPEIDEVFLVRLLSVSLVGSGDEASPPVLAASGTEAEVKITANDGAQGVLEFASQSRSVQVNEATPMVTLTILRNGTFGQVSVAYYARSITQETLPGTDYRLDPGELVFAPEESHKFLQIEIIDDNLPEPHEQFEIVLSAPKHGATLGQNIRAIVTILANDDSAGFVTFGSPARLELQEPREGNEAGSKAELSVQRGPGIFGRVTVPFVITDVYDTPTTDVSPSAGVVEFEDRQGLAVIELTAVDDDDPEAEEVFFVKLRTPDNGAQLGNTTTATVIVRQSDSPFGLFQIYPADTRLSTLDVEEDVGTIPLEVTRTKGQQGRVSVDVVTTSVGATYLPSLTDLILAELQTVPAARVSAWHLVEAGEATFVLMLTSLAATEQLRDLLPEGSPVGTGQSVLFRWQGELTYLKTLTTDGATAADSFSVGNKTFFVVANSGKEGAREVQSVVYRLDPDEGNVEAVQGLTTHGATDVKHFVHNNQLYLAVTNALDDDSRSDIESFIFTWSTVTQKFSPSPSQQIPTLYARAVEVFVISDVVYMAVANYYDRESSSYEIHSVVYRKEADGSFVQHQRLSSAGATDVAYFAAGGGHYLVVASNRQNAISSPQTSHLYRWDSTSLLFVQNQTLSTTRVSAMRVLTLPDQTVLLAIANSVGASKIMRWNVATSRFETAWSGKPYLLLQPMNIQQRQRALPLLATADVITQNDSVLYQVAQISDGSDFVQRRVTLTFEPNQRVLHTTVVVLQDGAPEDTESFTVDLVNPQNGAEVGPQASVTINILSNDNAHGIIQFAPDSLEVYTNEVDGMNHVELLSVTRKGGSFGRVVVRWIATGDHDGLRDISPLFGTVEFGNNVNESTIAITIIDDSIAELAEVTYIQLTEIVDDGTDLQSGGARLGEATQAKITVLANDSPFGVVSWSSTSLTTPEPENTNRELTLTIRREQGLRGQLRVSYVTSMALELPRQQQATSGEDFLATQGYVTFGVNDSEASVSVTILQDDTPEASETFFVNITEVMLVTAEGESSAQPSIRVPGNVAEITILENDGARGMVQFDVETNVEGRVDTYEEYGRNNTVTLLLRRYVGLLGRLTVTWQTVSVTANNRDFSPWAGSVQFADGQETAEINITIVDDTITEGLESFDVKLIDVTGDAVLGSITTVRIAILKNDSPTGLFKFATREVEIKESKTDNDPQGRADLVVKRVWKSEGRVEVRWRLNAEAQEDLEPLEGVLLFLQGVTEQTFSVHSRQDNVLEGQETFTVSLQSADNNADISPTEADARIIIQPDTGASGTISILPASRSVLIGEPGEYSSAYDGTARIELSRAAGIYGEVDVSWVITPRDATAFLQVTGTVKFLDQQQTATIVLQARDDSKPEQKTSYVLRIDSASGGASISPESVCNILFVASDHPHGLFEFTLPEMIYVSEDDQSVRVTVRRSKGQEGQVQVKYTTSEGTATEGEDFNRAEGFLIFASGQNSSVVEVSLRRDDMAEGPETFFINLTSVSLVNPSDSDFTAVDGLQRDMPPKIGAVAVKTIVIEKNDNAEGIIEFENAAVMVQEEAQMAQISVIRRTGSFGVVRVSYQTQTITATAGVDYLPSTGTLQLEDGQKAAMINVTLLDDEIQEFEEKFNVTLSNPTGGVLLGNIRTAVVTILKSDFPNGKFGFAGATERSIPNPSTAQSLTFEVERTEGLLGQQTVHWRIMGPNNPTLELLSTADVSHTANGRESTSGQFTWQDGEAGGKQFTLTVKRRTSPEIAKTFVIEIYRIQASPTSVGDGEISPTAGKVVLTVQKYGDPNGIIEFTDVALVLRELQEPGSEPQELRFPVKRQTGTGSEGALQIHWEVRGPVGPVRDVSPQNGTLLLADSVRQGQIILQILPDDVPELTEEFILQITGVEGGADLNEGASLSKFRITYNDNPHGLIGIVSANQEVVVEADFSRSLKLNFSRYDGTFGRVALTYDASYDEPSSGITLLSRTGSVTFEEGQGSAVASVPISEGFLRVDSTFTVSLLSVQYVGSGVTQPPQLKARETEARVAVPPLAANSEVSFLRSVVNVNDVEETATLTVVRNGVYGSVTVYWATGQPEVSLPTGVTNGYFSPASGTVRLPHGAESKNFTVQVTARIGQAEIFLVRLPQAPETSVSGGARLASQNIQVTLDPAGVVRFMPASLKLRVSEVAGQVEVSMCRVYGVSGRITVMYSTEDLTARGSYDYQVIQNNEVTMSPNQALVNIFVTILPDNIPEQSEQFFVKLLKVEKLPTPPQPIISPRLDSQSATAVITIAESNDPYGVLWFETDVTTESERPIEVPLTIRRTGGLFGRVSVRVRTVGGGEQWTSEIVVDTDTSSRDTISQALGQRRPNTEAKVDKDYRVLDTVVYFEADESAKRVNVHLLDDNVPERQESVLVYLTQVTGGARVARGTPDGGHKGFAEIFIRANDVSNGIIGFDEQSKSVVADEDVNPTITLTLTRLNADYGNVVVFWKAKMSETSSDEEDGQLTHQLEAVSGNTTCFADVSLCDLVLRLQDDTKPEESFTFVVKLERAGDDAILNNASLYSTITVLPSDNVRGLVQIVPTDSVKIVGDDEDSVRIGVQRVQGSNYDVTVSYSTMMMVKPIVETGISIYLAEDGADYEQQDGVLVFYQRTEVIKYITIKLTPEKASVSPYPKQFYVNIHSATNGASVNAVYNRSTVRIVRESDVEVFRIINRQQDRPLDDTSLLETLGGLDGQARGPLSDTAVTLIDDMIKKVNEEGESRQLPTTVQDSILDLFCKLLDPSKNDGTRGRYSLADRIEGFAHNLLTGRSCPAVPPVDDELIRKECEHVIVSAGRWHPVKLQGYDYEAKDRDTFSVPRKLTLSTGVDGVDDECVDFHIIEYSSRQWFPIRNGEGLLNNRVLSFGLKGRPSSGIDEPVNFRIHTPDNRIAAKRASCVYFDMSTGRWVNPQDVCYVRNDLRLATDNFVDCSCGHMTSYAIIAEVYDSGIIGYTLWFYIITLFCMSCIGIVIVAHHLCHKQPTFSASLLQHMLFAVFATLLCLVVDAYFSDSDILARSMKEDNTRCIAMGLFLHYFFLTQFMWIMMQAFLCCTWQCFMLSPSTSTSIPRTWL